MNMTDQISVLLHWNLDYAEFPRSETENIINLSYIPMVNDLLNQDLGPILMNITGHTLQYLRSHHEPLIEKLVTLVDNDQIELVGSAYSHPILPLLPRWRRREQLESHRHIIEEIFNQVPKGFWPPEEAISPIIVNEIMSTDYEWVCVDHEHLHIAQDYFNEFDPFTQRESTVTETLVKAFWAKWWEVPYRYLKSYKVAKKWMKWYREPLVETTNLGQKVNLMQTSVAWTNSTIFALQHTPPFFTKKKLAQMIAEAEYELLPLYASDIEFFGYRSHTGDAPTPTQFVGFLVELQDRGIELQSPTRMENTFKKSNLAITSGSWAPDKSFQIWTDSEDNKELTRRLDEVYRRINILRSKKSLEEDEYQEIRRLLRIAENSDARGWSPINERKHEAFEAISSINQLLFI